MRFEETGPIPAEQWGSEFGPFDHEGRRVPFDEHPLVVEVREGRAGHHVERFRLSDGSDYTVDVSAIPLLGTSGFEGALVFFWPARSP